jgi:hypothetical protein
VTNGPPEVLLAAVDDDELVCDEPEDDEFDEGVL